MLTVKYCLCSKKQVYWFLHKHSEKLQLHLCLTELQRSTALWPRWWTASARLQPAVILAANVNLSALARDPCIRAPWAWATRRPATPPPTLRSVPVRRLLRTVAARVDHHASTVSTVHIWLVDLYLLRFYVFTKNRIQVLMGFILHVSNV